MTECYQPERIQASFIGQPITGLAGDGIDNAFANDRVTWTDGIVDSQCSISANGRITVTVTLLQNSPTNKWFQENYDKMRAGVGGVGPYKYTDSVSGDACFIPSAKIEMVPPHGRKSEAPTKQWRLGGVGEMRHGQNLNLSDSGEAA